MEIVSQSVVAKTGKTGCGNSRSSKSLIETNHRKDRQQWRSFLFREYSGICSELSRSMSKFESHQNKIKMAMRPVTEELPKKHQKDWWLAVLYNLLISAVLSLFFIYVLGAYGLALFIVLPFFIGFFPVWIYMSKKKRVKRRERYGKM